MFKKMIRPETLERLQKVSSEMDRLYDLPDRFLAREIINTSRAAINAYPDRLGHLDYGGYENLLVAAAMPRMASILGETGLTATERQMMRRAPEGGVLLREFVGNCLGNACFRFTHDNPDIRLHALDRSFVNGSLAGIAIDRAIPPVEESRDWITQHTREISRARFGDDRFISWSPKMQEYKGHRNKIIPQVATEIEEIDPTI